MNSKKETKNVDELENSSAENKITETGYTTKEKVSETDSNNLGKPSDDSVQKQNLKNNEKED